jgi:hypothetical protein
MTLTVLALAMKILVPQGFMVADRGAPFPLVICTGHGAAVFNVDAPGFPKAPAPKKSDQPCAFAGNITPPHPSAIAIVSETVVFSREIPGNARTFDLAPGRGLAAPPPQSHAPPTVSI